MNSHSHPDQSVRHSYPLAVTDSGLGTAFSLFTKTLPFSLARFGILFACSVGTVIWFGLTFGGAALLSRLHDLLGAGWMIGGLGVYGWFFWTIIRYGLYLLKAGHIAILTELITLGHVADEGKGMFRHGKDVVTARFRQVNLLFALDMLISGVVRAFNRTLEGLAGFLPIPGLDGIARLVGAIVNAMTTFIDEAIFSYNLARGDENPWRSSRDGLVYYCQNAMEILKASLWIVVLEYFLIAAAWILLMIPAVIAGIAMPGVSLGLWLAGLAALVAWNIREAFLHPFFLIMVLVRYHVAIQGQQIDKTWDARLSGLSSKFGEIKDKAASWAGETFGGPERRLSGRA